MADSAYRLVYCKLHISVVLCSVLLSASSHPAGCCHWEIPRKSPARVVACWLLSWVLPSCLRIWGNTEAVKHWRSLSQQYSRAILHTTPPTPVTTHTDTRWQNILFDQKLWNGINSHIATCLGCQKWLCFYSALYNFMTLTSSPPHNSMEHSGPGIGITSMKHFPAALLLLLCACTVHCRRSRAIRWEFCSWSSSGLGDRIPRTKLTGK